MLNLGRTLSSLSPALLLAWAALSPVPARAAFACPVKAPPATRPLPADLGETLKPYDDPRADGALRADIGSMIRDGMPRGEIVDHVVDAYCGVIVAVPKLTDADKTGLVQRFASHLAQAVYAPERSAVEDVLLDVPVPTDLYSKVKEAAEQRHETQDAFALAALRRATASP